MDSTTHVLIAAVSGRALAASARRGGYVPLVTDFFGDEDTLALAHAHVRLDAGLARGMDADELLGALAALAAPQQPAGTVCGTGFEDRPEVLARVAQRWRLLGNSPDTVARVKDPLAFAALCRGCDVPHPATSTTPPDDPSGWLAKRRGGGGGTHVTMAADSKADAKPGYFQRRVVGTPVSALVLAAGGRAMVLGFSAQWSAPLPDRPFRYGGAVRPATLAPAMADALTDAVQSLVSAVPLIGLNSFDFLVDGDAFWLLEINPRPGATLDIFETAETSLFALHMAATRGVLPARPPTLTGAAATAIAYAPHDIHAVPVIDWPQWTADRQTAGTTVKAGEPVCTVLASAHDADAAKDLVDRRTAAILAAIAARLP